MRVGNRPTRWVGFFLGTAIAVALLAACVPIKEPPPPPPPPPPPSYATQYCAPTTTGTPAAYQSALDNMRLAGVEWAAADGGAPTVLPDGRVLWLFGDTFTGQINGDGSLAPDWRIVRNSFVVQQGACFRPLMGGAPNDRADVIPAPGGLWYWPSTAIVEPTATGNVLRMFLSRMTTNDNPAPWNFEFVDTQLATFTLPGLSLVNIGALPNGIYSGPDYAWGGSAVTGVDNFIYVYGGRGDKQSQDCDPGRERRVARVERGKLTTGPWQFFDGTTWGSDPAAAALIQFVADAPLPATACTAKPLDTLNVVPNPGGGYVAGGKLGELRQPNSLFGTEISKWTASAPEGPWHYTGKVADAVVEPNQFSYGASLRFNLPGGTPTVLYSVNSFDDVAQDISLYGLRFRSPNAP
jgi:hypothetical protein